MTRYENGTITMTDEELMRLVMLAKIGNKYYEDKNTIFFEKNFKNLYHIDNAFSWNLHGEIDFEL